MTKLPWLKFYPADWMSDPCLSQCSPETRGIWIDALCCMHASGRQGEIAGRVDRLARMCRCSPEQMESALEELHDTGTASVTRSEDVPNRPAIVRLMSRRMSREHKSRRYETLRKRQQRGPASVPPLSRGRGQKSEVRGQIKTPPTPSLEFDSWYSKYPKKVGKRAAAAAWKRSNGTRPPIATMHAALDWQVKSRQWTESGGQFIPNPATYLNQGRWDDEPVADTSTPGATARSAGYEGMIHVPSEARP